ncbi:MAG: hypothetical protein NVS2B8_17060 [Vulcanimicrobiaceae bacterium]
MATESMPEPRESDAGDASDDLAQIRYSLSALGEAFVADRKRARFRGFGPCNVAKIGVAG